VLAKLVLRYVEKLHAGDLVEMTEEFHAFKYLCDEFVIRFIALLPRSRPNLDLSKLFSQDVKYGVKRLNAGAKARLVRVHCLDQLCFSLQLLKFNSHESIETSGKISVIEKLPVELLIGHVNILLRFLILVIQGQEASHHCFPVLNNRICCFSAVD